MTSPILTRRKWMIRAHGQHIVVVKGTRERITHPLMKAFLWALYLPHYPHSTIEVKIGDRYKPDVVAFAPDEVRFRANEPIFWGEAGEVALKKVQALAKRYPRTHFAIAKWDLRLQSLEQLVREALVGIQREAPFDLLSFPAGSEEGIDADGNVTLTFADIVKITL
jgi:hypothetical protein